MGMKRKYNDSSATADKRRRREIDPRTERLESGSRQLFQAVKLARGFERQKLGRRQKASSKSEEERGGLVRILGEITALKELDLHRFARQHLVKTLRKRKSLASSEVLNLLSPTNEPQEALKNVASQNVAARLANSNVVKSCLPSITAGLEKVLANTTEVSAQKKQSHTAEDATLSASEAIEENRIASFDEEDSSSSPTSSVADLKTNGTASLLRNTLLDGDGDGGEKDDDDDDAVEAEEQGGGDRGQITTKGLPQTTFLPTLTHGGYISGSGSSFEGTDDDGEVARKNRPGQRARRQIWEKKYGAGARHLQSQKASNRDQDWDIKRGARGTASTQSSNRYNRPRQDSMVNRTKRMADVQHPRTGEGATKDTQAGLHPSWEAARQAKKRHERVAFEGRKTTFD